MGQQRIVFLYMEKELKIHGWGQDCYTEQSRKAVTRVQFASFRVSISADSRSQWPRGLRSRFAAAGLLRSWVRIPLEACKFVCCEFCVFCQVEVSATS
jgi:hypothetical protein